MKKMVVIALSLVLCLLVFSGCGGESNENLNQSQATSTPTPTSTTTPTQTPVNTLTPTEQPKETPKSASSTSNDNFLEAARTAAKDGLGDGEAIKKVELENGELCIYVDFSNADPTPFTIDELAVSRTSSITDEILKLKTYDASWDTITVDFGSVGRITNKKSSAQDNGYGGRYFPSSNFKLVK